MDSEPLHSITTHPILRRKPSFLLPLLEDDEVLPPPQPFSASPLATPPSSFKDRLIFGPRIGDVASPSSSSSLLAAEPSSSGDGQLPVLPTSIHTAEAKINHLHRSRTAPAMANLKEVLGNTPWKRNETISDGDSSTHIVRHAFVLLAVYLTFGVVVYTVGRDQFSSAETHPVVDALYFSIVTMCTIGYGDITPKTTMAKMFSIAFVIVGFGFVDILLGGMVSYVLDHQESLLLSAVRARASGRKHDAGSYLVDLKKGRMRIRMKVGIALGAVVLCVGVGTAVLHFVERLGWFNSFYLAVMSVTTVGYGDHAFGTFSGRLFASAWLLVSTLAVARAFLYLAELRIDRRHRRIAKWVLGRDMTVSEFLAADMDQNGFVSKSEFVIYKLKEMGRLSEKDIADISVQFHRMDAGNSGKITLMDLVDVHRGTKPADVPSGRKEVES